MEGVVMPLFASYGLLNIANYLKEGDLLAEDLSRKFFDAGIR